MTPAGDGNGATHATDGWQNFRMSRRRFLVRWVSWFALAALLLRAATPLLATGAAQLRGVDVGSVCPVVGVVLPDSLHTAHSGHGHHAVDPAQPIDPEDHAPGSGATHDGDRCAITALAEFAGFPAGLFAVAGDDRPDAASRVEHGCADWADGSAMWVAGHKQGPPSLA
jgi:hypothetical protein